MRARPPHRAALALAAPAIASNVAVPLAGLVDTAMLGHFATAVDIGAVGLGAAVIATLYWMFGFLRMGTTSLVGRALGADDEHGAVMHTQRAFGLAAVIGVGWIALQWLVVPIFVGVLAPEGSARDAALDYTLIRGLSIPVVLATLVIVGYFIGAKNTQIPLVVAVTVSVTNIVLDLVFVGALEWGSAGAAWGTVGAELVGFAVAAVAMWHALGTHVRKHLLDVRARALRRGWGALARFNGAIMARTAILMAVVTFVASIGARISPEVLAANAILLQFMHLASYALDGYANAAEALVAHAAGSGSVPELNAASVATALPMTGIALVLAATFWFAREPILQLLTDLPHVQEATLQYMGYAALLPLVSAAAWFFDGVYLGAGRPGFMLVSMVFSAGLVFVPILLIGATRNGALTNDHVWTAFLSLNVARAASLGAMYPALIARVRMVEGVPPSRRLVRADRR